MQARHLGGGKERHAATSAEGSPTPAHGILAAMNAAALDADWPRLWALADRLAQRAGRDPDHVLSPLGLRFNGPDGDRWSYDATPVNSTTFASTGGDGVHFGLLHDTTAASPTAPVVMTVPTQFDAPNYVVGASLQEFLALGCHTGYLHLEQLAYPRDRQDELSRLETDHWDPGWEGWAEPEPANAPAELLAALTQEFDLAPWANVEQRLTELQARYLPIIQLRQQQP
jgi:hypothetical protein